MSEELIYIGTSHRVDLGSTRVVAVDGTTSFVNAADSCGYSLKDLAGVEISAGSMGFVVDSDGRYTAVIPHTATALLIEDQRYDVFVTLVASGLQLVKHLRRRAARYD